tara:strand:+ start:142 stop:6657 length:6516 start_codon:yes stop_codon:yes gene_type:complete
MSHLNIKEQPHPQHISQDLINTQSVSVGRSGELKVDARFKDKLSVDKSGKLLISGYGVSKTGIQAPSSQDKRDAREPGAGLISLITAPHNTFKYTLTNMDSKGNRLTILSALQNAEHTSSTTDYYTGHYQGQIASQVAYELQERYGKPPTAEDMKKMPAGVQAEDQVKIDYLASFITSAKMKTIYSDPKFASLYPSGVGTYMKFIYDPAYIATIQNLVNNRNRGLLLTREQQELKSIEGWHPGSTLQTKVHGRGVTETQHQYDLAIQTKIAMAKFLAKDPNKMTLLELHSSLATLTSWNNTYDRLQKIKPGDRTIAERIGFYNLDLHLNDLQQRFIDFTELTRVKARVNETTDIETFRKSNELQLNTFYTDIRNLKTMGKTETRKAEVIRLIRVIQAQKRLIITTQSSFPNIMKEKEPPSSDHLILANAYGNWSTLFNYFNPPAIYYGLIGGDFSSLNSIPPMTGYTPPTPYTAPKPVVKVQPTHTNPQVLPKETFESFVSDVDKTLSETLKGEWSSTKNPVGFYSKDSRSLETAFTKTQGALDKDPSKMNIEQLKLYITELREAQGRQNTIGISLSDQQHKMMIDVNAITKLQKRMIVVQGQYNILELKKEKQDTIISTNHSGIKTVAPKVKMLPDPLLQSLDQSPGVQSLVKSGQFTTDQTGGDGSITNDATTIFFLRQAIDAINKTVIVKPYDALNKKNHLDLITSLYKIRGRMNRVSSTLVDNTVKSSDYISDINVITTNKDAITKRINSLVIKYKSEYPINPPATGKSQAVVGSKKRGAKGAGKTDDMASAQWLEDEVDRIQNREPKAGAGLTQGMKAGAVAIGALALLGGKPTTAPPTTAPPTTAPPTRGILKKKDLDKDLQKLPTTSGNLNGKKVGQVKWSSDDNEDNEELIDRRYLYHYYFDLKGEKTYVKPYRVITDYNGETKKYPIDAKELRQQHLQFNFTGSEIIENKRNPYAGGKMMDSEALRWLGGAVGAYTSLKQNPIAQEVVGFFGNIVERTAVKDTDQDLRINLLSGNILSDTQRLQEQIRQLEMTEDSRDIRTERIKTLIREISKGIDLKNPEERRRFIRENTPGIAENFNEMARTVGNLVSEAGEDLEGVGPQATALDTERLQKEMTAYAVTYLEQMPDFTFEEFFLIYEKVPPGVTAEEYVRSVSRTMGSYGGHRMAFQKAKEEAGTRALSKYLYEPTTLAPESRTGPPTTVAPEPRIGPSIQQQIIEINRELDKPNLKKDSINDLKLKLSSLTARLPKPQTYEQLQARLQARNLQGGPVLIGGSMRTIEDDIRDGLAQALVPEGEPEPPDAPRVRDEPLLRQGARDAIREVGALLPKTPSDEALKIVVEERRMAMSTRDQRRVDLRAFEDNILAGFQGGRKGKDKITGLTPNKELEGLIAEHPFFKTAEGKADFKKFTIEQVGMNKYLKHASKVTKIAYIKRLRDLDLEAGGRYHSQDRYPPTAQAPSKHQYGITGLVNNREQIVVDRLKTLTGRIAKQPTNLKLKKELIEAQRDFNAVKNPIVRGGGFDKDHQGGASMRVIQGMGGPMPQQTQEVVKPVNRRLTVLRQVQDYEEKIKPKERPEVAPDEDETLTKWWLEKEEPQEVFDLSGVVTKPGRKLREAKEMIFTPETEASLPRVEEDDIEREAVLDRIRKQEELKENKEARTKLNDEIERYSLEANDLERKIEAETETRRSLLSLDNVEPALQFAYKGLIATKGAVVGYHATRLAQPFIQAGYEYAFPTVVEPPDSDPDPDPDPGDEPKEEEDEKEPEPEPLTRKGYNNKLMKEIIDKTVEELKKKYGEISTSKDNERRSKRRGSRPLEEGEIHYKDANFMGPGTTRKYMHFDPINYPDAVAKRHDKIFYNIDDMYNSGRINDDTRKDLIRKADENFINALKNVGKLRNPEEETYRQAGLMGIQSKNLLENLSPEFASMFLPEDIMGRQRPPQRKVGGFDPFGDGPDPANDIYFDPFGDGPEGTVRPPPKPKPPPIAPGLPTLARGPEMPRFADMPPQLRNALFDIKRISPTDSIFKMRYNNLINSIKDSYMNDRDYDKEVKIARGLLDEIMEEDKKRKKKLNPAKPMLYNTFDPHVQHPNKPPVGFTTHKTYRKKPLDNFKQDSNKKSTGYRTLMKQIGTSDERVNAQRRRNIFNKDENFDLPQKEQKYNYKRII